MITLRYEIWKGGYIMRDENCIFCKIANGEIPSSTVYEDEDFRVILDLGPASLRSCSDPSEGAFRRYL